MSPAKERRARNRVRTLRFKSFHVHIDLAVKCSIGSNYGSITPPWWRYIAFYGRKGLWHISFHEWVNMGYPFTFCQHRHRRIESPDPALLACFQAFFPGHSVEIFVDDSMPYAIDGLFQIGEHPVHIGLLFSQGAQPVPEDAEWVRQSLRITLKKQDSLRGSPWYLKRIRFRRFMKLIDRQDKVSETRPPVKFDKSVFDKVDRPDGSDSN